MLPLQVKSQTTSIPWSKSTSAATESDEPLPEKLTSDTDKYAADAKTDDTTDAANMSNPPSLVDLASQCVSASSTEKRRAWADMPVEPSPVHASSGPCYDLDPTPQEAAAAAAAAVMSQKPTSSDSGGEDSAKENKETPSDRNDNGKGVKKKGL